MKIKDILNEQEFLYKEVRIDEVDGLNGHCKNMSIWEKFTRDNLAIKTHDGKLYTHGGYMYWDYTPHAAKNCLAYFGFPIQRPTSFYVKLFSPDYYTDKEGNELSGTDLQRDIPADGTVMIAKSLDGKNKKLKFIFNEHSRKWKLGEDESLGLYDLNEVKNRPVSTEEQKKELYRALYHLMYTAVSDMDNWDEDADEQTKFDILADRIHGWGEYPHNRSDPYWKYWKKWSDMDIDEGNKILWDVFTGHNF